MRFSRFVFGASLFALCLLGCDSSSDHAGIEIGNPEIAARTFSARFLVDYGSDPEPKWTIDGLDLSLLRLANYSSYYIYVSFDLSDGLTLWPEASDASPMPILFANDPNEDQGDWTAAFGNIEIDGDGRLKEIGARFSPTIGDEKISGSMQIDGVAVPYEFSLAGIDSLETRYLKNQLDTAADGAISLTVKFRVPEWIDGLDLSCVEFDAGTVLFDASHNAALWDSLTKRFTAAFSGAHWLTYYADGTVEELYDSLVLSQHDFIDSNWVSNGTFDSAKDWILVEQLGGNADTAISNNSIAVKVSQGGSYNYSVQLIHEDIPLLKGRKYKLVFTAIADTAKAITVRLGSYNTYKTEALEKQVRLNTDWMSYEFEYTALVDDLFARLEFNLGKFANRYQIKDVKIYRID